MTCQAYLPLYFLFHLLMTLIQLLQLVLQVLYLWRWHTVRVGPNHTCIRIYSICTVFLAG